MTTQPIRLLIVDDHHLAREGVKEILEDQTEFEIVGEASNGIQAVEKTEALMPDLVLMDISMPKMNGFEATKEIKKQFPNVKVVIMTVSYDITDWFEALKRGAQGYLLKNLNTEDMLNGLKAYAMDEIPMSKEMAFRIWKEFKKDGQAEQSLSLREQEVLQLVAKGHSNKDISKVLTISENTVKTHMKNILGKLHLENRVQLASYAYDNGIV
ncbi:MULTISPECIES: response regulator [Fictibacillus]|jgi:DNA-binding NarL/FixJ family response regulator|uniref:response regulator n=1 Tax=Fictibacillus TaxID=1329200 RepID=UPI0018CFE7FA|nr:MULTISPECIES: response regulator transcription factor [unclassified Fictibacillus]MBH0165121.1 response regulator transcription factor [Fictibacillus sp. 7GRE50]MBH0172286.1 response regulator transcription factor [Fictibacillus sp. 23RED33]